MNIGPFASVDECASAENRGSFADPLAIGQCITEAVFPGGFGKTAGANEGVCISHSRKRKQPGRTPIKTPEQVEFSAPKPEPLPQRKRLIIPANFAAVRSIAYGQCEFSPVFAADVFREDAAFGRQKLGNAKNRSNRQPEKLPLQSGERHSLGQAPLVLGQLFETYLLVQSQNDFYILDQHAGHERLTYDAYKQQILQSEIASQPLLVPDILQLTFAEMEAFSDHQETFSQLGFDVAAFGEREVIVRAYPLVLGKVALAQFFTDVLDHIFNGQNVKMTDMIMDKLIRSACRHSIKAGDALEAKEMESPKRKQRSADLPAR
ncbi:MAG: hypothetical protein ACLT0Y_06485 [Christensenellales bacterium]